MFRNKFLLVLIPILNLVNPKGGKVLFDFFKAKSGEKFYKIFILTLYRSKTVLPIFGRKKYNVITRTQLGLD